MGERTGKAKPQETVIQRSFWLNEPGSEPKRNPKSRKNRTFASEVPSVNSVVVFRPDSYYDEFAKHYGRPAAEHHKLQDRGKGKPPAHPFQDKGGWDE
jgi:hypothetical protein